MSARLGRQPTKFRQAFRRWEQGRGQRYKRHTPGSPNYIVAIQRNDSNSHPRGERVVFPDNPHFRSQPVLSEAFKEEVWQAVVKKGVSVRQASVDYSLDIRRVGAVVRMKEIEKQWIADGKQLAIPYSQAIMEMLPQSDLPRPGVRQHETINDLIVHPATKPQLFWPTPETQHFTRVEAGKAFEKTLLPAEARIPHTQLYAIEKRQAQGDHPDDAKTEEWQRIGQEDVKAYQKTQQKIADREKRTTTVQTPRWQFKFESVVVDKASTGRYTDGIGQRYGVPHNDRKKSVIKIPTQVDG